MALAVEAAEREAKKRGVVGGLRTPFLLSEIARLTQNKSLEANIALLVSNARLAAEVASAMSSHRH
jgi:pseudouridine-5'-phosphate glycosidase